ncbi:phosphoribosylaminoimidazole-succinocarboxamidesynthase domain protein [Orientia tsutsugamushi str. Gilliam]|nr:hypothetical protein [Orientia tsutsugamushi]KJV53476.1 phosphoribosylaminoimidazole-succinocarboxamidesynthase domain protein [Orientia tsutsugamushi str. Gilliam]
MRINAEKVIQVSDKGVLNNVISNYIFKRVSMVGINPPFNTENKYERAAYLRS